MRRGDIIRETNGNLLLYRVEETYDEESPYIFVVLVSNGKYHKAGTEKRLVRKENCEVMADPDGYARRIGMTWDRNVPLVPWARWA